MKPELKEMNELEETEWMVMQALNEDNRSFATNQRGRHGKTVLMLTCKYLPFGIVKKILSLPDVDVSLKDDFGYPALWHACQAFKPSKTKIEAILQHKTFCYFVHEIENREWVKALERIDADSREQIRKAVETAHHLDSENVKQVISKSLSEASSVESVSSLDQFGRNLLHLACEFVPDVVSLLLERDDIDINSRNANSGLTALMIACRFHSDIVPLLLQHERIDVNCQSDRGSTALMYACQYQPTCVQHFLNHGRANFNLQNFLGNSALKVACTYHPEAVSMLLEKDDININLADEEGRTPLMDASQFQSKSVEALFKRWEDIDVNAQDKQGLTALMLACNNPDSAEAALALLLHPEINVNIPCTALGGVPALYFACSRSTPEVILALLKQEETSRTFQHEINNFIDFAQVAKRANQPDTIQKAMRMRMHSQASNLERSASEY
uniref:Uncharacterized protein n=1 Tax=Aplanochytrium stocchinoi TaxID=215587 RepID=A0A7S3V0R0_9STRA